MHFLNAYICLDLGQEESQKAWKILVIKFLALLRPVVLKLLKKHQNNSLRKETFSKKNAQPQIVEQENFFLSNDGTQLKTV